MAEAYLANPVAQRSVRIVAEGVGSAPVACDDARLARLLAKSCGSQPLLEVLAAQLALHGNAYVQLIKDGAGVPVELYPLRPERVQVVAGEDGWPTAYRYVLADRTLTIALEDEHGWPNIIHLRGGDIRPEHWDAFWAFYQDTGARKWGTPYLTRAAFDLLGERMGEKILLVLALQDGEPVAGALNFIGGDALYGRYWGCTRDIRFLHFELCYYQAIEAAIELGLARVEAGAQGGHKLARGYEPVETVSAHWFADAGFRSAVEDFLERERAGVAADRNYLATRTPFRKD